MSDDAQLADFINNLPSLDSNLSEAELIQNTREAYERFQNLTREMQGRVMNEANSRLGITQEKIEAYTPDERTQRVYETATRRKLSEKSAIAPAVRPARFEDKWTNAAANARLEMNPNYSAGNNSDFARRHGEQAANSRHGYMQPGRQAQLDRIASIQAEAKRTGKSFSEVADARVAAGR